MMPLYSRVYPADLHFFGSVNHTLRIKKISQRKIVALKTKKNCRSKNKTGPSIYKAPVEKSKLKLLPKAPKLKLYI